MSDIYINHMATITATELRESFVRSTGPGGQNVNKVSTKVELRWCIRDSQCLREVDRDYLLMRLGGRLADSGDLIVSSEVHRTQARNRQEVRTKLGALVRDALVRPKRRRATKPSRAVHRRRLDGKKRRSKLKQGRSKTYED